MSHPRTGDFAPYEEVPVGFEAMYTGGDESDAMKDTSVPWDCYADADGNAIMRYSLWGAFFTREEDWGDEIRLINRMQALLGSLDDDTRAIRAQIASLVPCDSGFPVTVDEMLNAMAPASYPGTPFTPAAGSAEGRARRSRASRRVCTS